ncbi:MAG: transporter [Acidobacteria bacterium]|nr:transporter [Acidobacteriota bacterium]
MMRPTPDTCSCLVAAALLALAASATAQPATPVIVTDRPSFTNSPKVVGARMVQIEAGVATARDGTDAGTATRTSAPNTLVRLGMSSRVEFRLEMEGWIRASSGRPGREPESSASDLALAAEYQFARAEGLGVDLAVIAGATLPTGGSASTGNADPFARFVWNRPLGAASLGGTVNWSAPSADSERVRALDGSLVLGTPLRGAWSAFWEGVVRHQNVETDAATWLANAGVLRTFGSNLQLDAWVGRGLNDVAPDWRFGVGVGYRLRR